MNTRRLAYGLLAATFGAQLSACSERYLTTANNDVMVVVQDISERDGHKEATVHFTLAEPQPLDAARRDMTRRLIEKARFDCETGASGALEQTTILESGRTVTSTNPAPVMRKRTPGSISATIVDVVCNADKRAETATRRSMAAIEKDYLRRVSG